MSLSKKNYRVIAELIAGSRNKEELKEGLISYFKRDNPRFSESMFESHISKMKFRKLIK